MKLQARLLHRVAIAQNYELSKEVLNGIRSYAVGNKCV